MIAATAAQAVTFDPDEIILFQKRFEEGYDVQDERYETWFNSYQTLDQQSIIIFLVADFAGRPAHDPSV